MNYMAALSLLAQAGVLDQWVIPLVQLAVGLGLVIFVHELGHFIVAKAVGIKVEKFSLGFGPKIVGFTRGDTLYQLAALPLGGYIKMLGQEDFKPLEEGEQPDPRAYNNKPVWARLAVVSAGVVMNVIFAAVLFIAVGLMGINFPSPVVGAVEPGMPAASAVVEWSQPIPSVDFSVPVTASAPASQTAMAIASQPSTAMAAKPPVLAATTMPATASKTTGLWPGDRIVSINGKPITRFDGIFIKAALANPDETFTVEIERQLGDKKYVGMARMGVKKSDITGLLAFGVATPSTNTFVVADDGKPTENIKDGDRLVGINDFSIAGVGDINTALKNIPPSPLTLTLQRGDQKISIPDRPRIGGGDLTIDDEKVDVIVLAKADDSWLIEFADGRTEKVAIDRIRLYKPDSGILNIMGMSPRIAVRAVNPKTPAAKIDMKAGDIIVDYGDLGAAPTQKQLFEINDKYANKGTNIVLERDGKILPAKWVVPERNSDANRVLIGFSPMPDYGHTVVAAVEADSPVFAAGLRGGDKITQINGQPVKDWLDVFVQLRQADGKKVTISYLRNTQEGQVAIDKLTPWMFDPNKYEMSLDLSPSVNFKIMQVFVHKSDPVEAIEWGSTETVNSLLNTYVQIKSLIARTISYTELRGPLGIGSIAVQTARVGLSSFLYFMGVISVALAVLNFLPIPVVDGGHAAFLIAEKIRGKPIPIKVMNFIQYIGLVLLLALFCVAMWNDIGRAIHGKW